MSSFLSLLKKADDIENEIESAMIIIFYQKFFLLKYTLSDSSKLSFVTQLKFADYVTQIIDVDLNLNLNGTKFDQIIYPSSSNVVSGKSSKYKKKRKLTSEELQNNFIELTKKHDPKLGDTLTNLLYVSAGLGYFHSQFGDSLTPIVKTLVDSMRNKKEPTPVQTDAQKQKKQETKKTTLNILEQLDAELKEKKSGKQEPES